MRALADKVRDACDIGESLFTFFASLAYVPLFLLELQNRLFWILKELHKISFLWKYGDACLKPRNFTKNVWLINDFATQLFRGFMNIDIFFKIACTEPKV